MVDNSRLDEERNTSVFEISYLPVIVFGISVIFSGCGVKFDYENNQFYSVREQDSQFDNILYKHSDINGIFDSRTVNIFGYNIFDNRGIDGQIQLFSLGVGYNKKQYQRVG